MVLKLITIDLLIPCCSSLKEKRYVLNGLKTKLRRRFNVSVSEVDFQDKWQRCKLAVATVGADRSIVDSGCDKALKLIENDGRVQVLDYCEEIR
ncbi:MAG: DUF503 family protein [Candidatus Latescibacteria bacterium]|nr:DUF503 family protein [Candidatus Latescibacterota bacterium]NIO27330.1 DUF503 family protein [Candidatus Latescibacterota bacterium]NIO54854.1 DUF503 family protein [Candidatus Latescibacterota bacterium]NIT00937.1 DUF503 family protein [Candidatus Latescibacterota bacterium]NIT37860.1 DUF503 family protein [Candidatus Latescibacterota bacterium]